MVSRSVASILRDHVSYELEAIDRLYLNGYVPQLQYPSGFVSHGFRVGPCTTGSVVTVSPCSGVFVRPAMMKPASRNLRRKGPGGAPGIGPGGAPSRTCG